MERYILANLKRMFKKQDYEYCPYCGEKLYVNNYNEKHKEYICGIDNDYCYKETCTPNFEEKCIYLKVKE